jgi:hypothetical protein
LFAKLRNPTSANSQFKRLAATRAKLLVIDEIGYEPLDHLAATHFFRLICERYERGSIVLTSNKRFSEWGELIGDETLAAAILDRLLHHATTISITGESYRLKDPIANPETYQALVDVLPACAVEIAEWWRKKRVASMQGSAESSRFGTIRRVEPKIHPTRLSMREGEEI